MSHVDEQLPDYALGSLELSGRDAVVAHLATCPRCAGRLQAFTEALSALSTSLPEEPPDPAVTARILGAASGLDRFEHFIPTAAALLDLTEEAVRVLLRSVDDAAQDQPGPAEGITVRSLPGGPRLQGAQRLLVKIAPGSVFPEHGHAGDERVFVIQGGFRYDDGREIWRGDVSDEDESMTHSLTALPGPACLALVVKLPPRLAG